MVSSHTFSDLSVNSEYFQSRKKNDMKVSEQISRKESLKNRNDLQHVNSLSMAISVDERISCGDHPEYSIEMKRISKDKEASILRSR